MGHGHVGIRGHPDLASKLFLKKDVPVLDTNLAGRFEE
jgi:hypothetical protein